MCNNSFRVFHIGNAMKDLKNELKKYPIWALASEFDVDPFPKTTTNLDQVKMLIALMAGEQDVLYNISVDQSSPDYVGNIKTNADLERALENLKSYMVFSLQTYRFFIEYNQAVRYILASRMENQRAKNIIDSTPFNVSKDLCGLKNNKETANALHDLYMLHIQLGYAMMSFLAMLKVQISKEMFDKYELQWLYGGYHLPTLSEAKHNFYEQLCEEKGLPINFPKLALDLAMFNVNESTCSFECELHHQNQDQASTKSIANTYSKAKTSDGAQAKVKEQALTGWHDTKLAIMDVTQRGLYSEGQLPSLQGSTYYGQIEPIGYFMTLILTGGVYNPTTGATDTVLVFNKESGEEDAERCQMFVPMLGSHCIMFAEELYLANTKTTFVNNVAKYLKATRYN